MFGQESKGTYTYAQTRGGRYIKALIVLLLAIVFWSCGDEGYQPEKINLKAQDLPSQESWNSTVIFSDSGSVKAVLKAGYIAIFPQKNYTLIDSGATVDFYKDGQLVSVLTGKRGKVDDITKNIEMYDSVTVVAQDSSKLDALRLVWDNTTQKVSSDTLVKIKTTKEEIQGIGFESDQNLKNYVIYKVTGVF